MKLKPNIFSLVVILLTVSCSKKNNDEWCNNHKSLHPEHLESVAKVNIEYALSGLLIAQIKVLKSAVEYSQLKDVEQIIIVTADKSCNNMPAIIIDDGNSWLAKYTIDCGVNNKLAEVSVALLDHFVKINEVEASIKTPAASKHFVLSRQCSSPIFYL